jgi:secretion/DNA translocation related CpaE-like protein
MAQRTAIASPVRRRPLLVTGDPELLDDVLGIAARSGVELDVAPDPAAARCKYPAAPLVFVGVQAAAECARAGLPRRPGIVVIGKEDALDPPWSAAEAIGAEHVALLPTAGPWLADRITEAMGVGCDDGRLVTVIGGRGGAGASVFAAGLAVTAARAGLSALLLDADPLGGGADLVLGWESLDGLRWPGLSQTSGHVSAPDFVRALPRRGDLALLSWDRGESRVAPLDAMSAAIDAGRRGRQLIVVDLPRWLDEAATLALSAADLALLVVPAELRACAAAAKVAAMVSEHTNALALVVRGPAPGNLTTNEISTALSLPTVGTLRPEPGLARALERGKAPAGRGRGPLAVLCKRILDELGMMRRATA